MRTNTSYQLSAFSYQPFRHHPRNALCGVSLPRYNGESLGQITAYIGMSEVGGVADVG